MKDMKSSSGPFLGPSNSNLKRLWQKLLPFSSHTQHVINIGNSKSLFPRLHFQVFRTCPRDNFKGLGQLGESKSRFVFTTRWLPRPPDGGVFLIVKGMLFLTCQDLIDQEQEASMPFPTTGLKEGGMMKSLGIAF